MESTAAARTDEDLLRRASRKPCESADQQKCASCGTETILPDGSVKRSRAALRGVLNVPQTRKWAADDELDVVCMDCRRIASRLQPAVKARVEAGIRACQTRKELETLLGKEVASKSFKGQARSSWRKIETSSDVRAHRSKLG